MGSEQVSAREAADHSVIVCLVHPLVEDSRVPAREDWRAEDRGCRIEEGRCSFSETSFLYSGAKSCDRRTQLNEDVRKGFGEPTQRLIHRFDQLEIEF